MGAVVQLAGAADAPVKQPRNFRQIRSGLVRAEAGVAYFPLGEVRQRQLAARTTEEDGQVDEWRVVSAAPYLLLTALLVNATDDVKEAARVTLHGAVFGARGPTQKAAANRALTLMTEMA